LLIFYFGLCLAHCGNYKYIGFIGEQSDCYRRPWRYHFYFLDIFDSDRKLGWSRRNHCWGKRERKWYWVCGEY